MDFKGKFLNKLTDVRSWLETFYKNNGKKGVAYSLLLGLLGFYFFHTVAKHQGWLRKKRITGWHVFITGAGSGIGRAMSYRFASLGCQVTLADINEDAVKKVHEDMKQQGFRSCAVKCDVSVCQSIKEAAEIAEHEFGQVDILVNNAGIVSGKKIFENSEWMMEKTIAVNTTAHFYTVRQFLPKMIQSDRGHIVTIASAAGIVGVNGLADYCASKFGAVGFNESLRMEMKSLKSNVKTTCICPYFINTGMFEGVRTRFSLILPILEESYQLILFYYTKEFVANRIVTAVLQDEELLLLPWFCNLTILSRALLPVSWFDKLSEILGVSKSMDHFVGRN